MVSSSHLLIRIKLSNTIKSGHHTDLGPADTDTNSHNAHRGPGDAATQDAATK